MAELEIKIGGSDTSGQATESAATGISSIGEAAKTTTESAGVLGGVVTGALSVAMGEVLVQAVEGGVEALGEFINAALEGEVITERLNFQIEKQGEKAAITKQGALDLADSMKGLVGGSDEAALQMEGALIKFQHIGKDIFPEATQAAADLAAVMGISAPAAAQTLGRILDVPGAGLQRLRAAGVDFTADQLKLIKTLQATGDTAGAQKIILDQLTSSVGGAAKAAAGTLTGEMTILGNEFQDVGKSVLEIFLPAIHAITDVAMPPLETIIKSGTELLKGLVSGGDDLTKSFFGIVGGADQLAAALGVPKDIISDFNEIVGQLWGSLTTQGPTAFASLETSIAPVVTGAKNLLTAFASSLPMIQTYIGNMVSFATTQFNTFLPPIVANISGTLNTLAAFWRAHGDEVMAILNFAFRFIVTVIGGTITLISGIISAFVTLATGTWAAFSELLKGNWKGAWDDILLALATAGQTLLSTITIIFTSALNIVGSNLDTLRTTWQADWDMLVVIVKKIFTDLLLWLATETLQFIAMGQSIVDGITTGVMNAGKGLIDAVTKTVQSGLEAAKRALGIQSPSTAFFEIGKNTMAGMTGGILAGSSAVSSAVTQNMQSVVSSASDQSSTTQSTSISISVDARGSTDPSAIEEAGYRGTQRALDEAGFQASVRLRLGVT